jgi:hypothetical protein
MKNGPAHGWPSMRQLRQHRRLLAQEQIDIKCLIFSEVMQSATDSAIQEQLYFVSLGNDTS